MSVRSTVGDPRHPALAVQAKARAASVQHRIADAITSFAGSMLFVYLSAGMFVLPTAPTS